MPTASFFLQRLILFVQVRVSGIEIRICFFFFKTRRGTEFWGDVRDSWDFRDF